MRCSNIVAGLLLSLCISCNSGDNPQGKIQGTWKSLWQKDMTLELTLHHDNRFKVMLTRPDMVHTNLGWYSAEDKIFRIKDSVDYPLPVCNLTDTGKYHFRISGDTLQFQVIDDKCERRTYALQLEKFIRIN